MEYNCDCDFERHNNFLNNNKLTALLHSAAATSLNVAIASVAIAPPPIDGHTHHPSQWSTNCQLPICLWSACCSTNRITEHARSYLNRPSFSHAPVAAAASYPTVLAEPFRTLHHMLPHHMISALV